ncbi:MAG: NAD(P)/FAD-dependent oxidoreductase [Gammaproteobacteria bacterium]|nr:NAD(P)/FAD-dependent oxidoreductase [Gammaproteobacteria bacterium]
MKDKPAITRRDFINGVSYGLAASVAPIDFLEAKNIDPYKYPPALTGIRGNHPGSFDHAHRLALAGGKYYEEVIDLGETNDLIVVGAGISGLSASYFYQERTESNQKILILDNHDDFGGHAKRNEFQVNGREMLTYGGSQSIESPSYYEDVSKKLMTDLGIDFQKFYTAYDFDYFKSRGLNSSFYFNETTFGQNKIVHNVPGYRYDINHKKNTKPENIQKVVKKMPISDQSKKEFSKLFLDRTDFFPEMTLEEKYYYLDSISYEDYLKKYHKVGDEVIGVFHSMLWALWGVGTESIPAFGAFSDGLPGFSGLGFTDEDDTSEPENQMYDLSTYDENIEEYMSKNEISDEPYIFHFPDGNATIARLLVRKMIPNSIAGSTMEDIVTAKADYSQLDLSGQRVNIRLDSTVISAKNTNDGVEVIYVKQGKLYKVSGKKCILACYNGIIPNLCPDLPKKQKEALKYNVKVPLVWVQVAMKNWHMFAKKGISRAICPKSFFNNMYIDFPVSIGEYQYPQSFDDPVVFLMNHVPTRPYEGLTNREQHRKGRYDILKLSYQDYEDKIFNQLKGMFGSDFRKEDVAGITVNRWAHGYSYEYNSLFDSDFFDGSMPDSMNNERYPHVIGRKPFGNISIANSDSGGSAYVDAAIVQADRAVNEILSG